MLQPTALPIRQIDDQVWVAPQLDAAAMVEAARAGFKAVVNNRPDFEGGPDQPTAASVAAAAAAAGLAYHHLPVSGAYQSPDEIAAFAQLLDTLPRPLLAFCRSGARSSKLYVAARALKP